MHEREVAGYVPKDFPGQARTLCLTQHWSGIRIVLLLLRLKAMIDLLLSRIKNGRLLMPIIVGLC